MFNWFGSRCPVEPEIKAWVEQRMTWLIGQFGKEWLTQREVILPYEDYFPDPYEGSQADARVLLERVCGYLDIDPSQVDLGFYSEHEQIALNVAVEGRVDGTAGLYDQEEGRTMVWLESSQMTNPMAVVATFAHELCHAHLLGGGRVSPEEEDHEPLTDLATVYFGMGVFTANASLRAKSYRWGNWESWSISRQGYLTAPVLAYALAVFAWLRQDKGEPWSRWLRLDVRSPFKKALAYLVRHGSTILESEAAQAFSCPASLRPRSRRQSEDAEAGPDGGADETARPAAPSRNSADDAFAQGEMHMQQGEWREAAGAFSEAIQREADDAEAYEQRALAFLRLGLLAEALADADHAVRLAPEDSECRRVRGMAFLYSGRYAQAIPDFDHYLEEEEVSGRDPTPLAIVHYLRGLAQEKNGELRRAVADLTRAIVYWPQWPAPYRARAEAYERLGKAKHACADREEAAWRAKEHGEGTTLP